MSRNQSHSRILPLIFMFFWAEKYFQNSIVDYNSCMFHTNHPDNISTRSLRGGGGRVTLLSAWGEKT